MKTTIENRVAHLLRCLRRKNRPLETSDPGICKVRDIFFVVGHPKSGTTWLSRILDNHPEISCRYEGHFFYRGDGYNTLSNALSTSSDLRRWATRDFNGWSQDFDTELQHIKKMIIQFYLQREAHQKGTSIIGDKSPSYDLSEMATLFPESKVIHVIRDGRDVAVSMAFHRSKETGRYMTEEVAQALDRDIADAKDTGVLHDLPENYILGIAKTWREEVHICRQEGRRLFGKNYFEVRYEDLHERPDSVAEKMFEFLGGSTTASVVKTCLRESSFKKMSGGRNCGEEDVHSFFRKGIVGDWKAVFSRNNVREFDSIAGDLLRELEYEN